MDMLWLGVALGALAASFAVGVAAVARAGSINNVVFGLTVAGQARTDPDFSAKLNALLAGQPPVAHAHGSPAAPPVAGAGTPVAHALGSPATPPAAPKVTGEAVRLLALLQGESRLVDFLLEDIAGAPDAQIGQAVKEIHRKAAKVLKDHLTLGVVMAGADGDRVTVAQGFDPSAVRVVGNVTGQPPFTGTLLHPGWRVKEVRLPALADGQDPFVLQPAEVELA
jgi:hypothetical protein